MPDIFHQFPINTSVEKVFEGNSTPKGLDNWWTKSSKGKPQVGEHYELFFPPEYIWAAVISKCVPKKDLNLRCMNLMMTGSIQKLDLYLQTKTVLRKVHFIIQVGLPITHIIKYRAIAGQCI